MSKDIEIIAWPGGADQTESMRQLRSALQNGSSQPLVLHLEGGSTTLPRADIAELTAQIAASARPVAAAIAGRISGPEVALALASRVRVAVADASLQLPEAQQGLLPAAGTILRLVQLAGVEAALPAVALGQKIPAKEAQQSGLIDAISAPAELIQAALNAASPKPQRSPANTESAAAAIQAFRQNSMRRTRGATAPAHAVRCVEAAASQPAEQALELENSLGAELEAGNEAAALAYLAEAERKAWLVPDIPADTPTIPVEKVGIIGAGTMGGGIAMNFANVGIPVTLVDTTQAGMERGLGIVRRNYEATAKRGRISMDDVERRMGLIQGTTSLDDVADCDLIIEAVFEDMALKKDIFAKLDSIVKDGAILATNTSALDIDEIATAVKRPEAVIGLHFFSPAHIMKLLEIVRADKTSRSVIATSLQLAKKIGKVATVVGVCPGFVGNRILFPRQLAAFRLLQEGAMPWDVDRVLTDFGMPMGPFAMADLAGLDIGWSRETSKGESLRDLLCEMDRFGQKNGKGYYDYDENRVARPSPVVEKLVRDFAAKSGLEQRPLTDEEILKRCLYPMINEGARILEEGKAIRPSDIDVVWVYGFGWPTHRGGPMFYADTIGLETVEAELADMANTISPALKPAKLISQLASKKRRFQDL